MPFGFDPRKIVLDNQLEKNKEVEEAVKKTLNFDEQKEKTETYLRKKSNIKGGLDIVQQIIREFKFEKKFGQDAYIDEKIKFNPEYRDKRLFTEEENKAYYTQSMKDMKGIMKGVKIDWKTFDNILPPLEDMNENQKRFFKKGKYAVDPTLESEYGIKEKKNIPVVTEKNGKLTTTSYGSVPFESDIGVIESINGAILSGLIKIPKGYANLSAMIMDWTGKENIKVDQSKVAQLERWWDQTLFGEIEERAESQARETAVGRITETLVQLIGGWKIVGSKADELTQTAFKMYNKAMSSVKKSKYLRTANNADGYKLAKEVSKWNSLSGKQKFIGVFVGGGVTGGLVYDAENIGTFGDLFFDDGELTALDRDGRESAKEDATRMLYNKLKFSGEMGFPIIPAVFGLGKIGKSILDGTVKRTANAGKFDKFVEKYIARPFRSRGPFPEEQFQAAQRLEGKKTSANLLATDYLRNIDEIVKNISKYSQSAAHNSGMTDELSEMIVTMINKGKLGVKNNKVMVKGFEGADLDNFYNSLVKKLKVDPEDATRLIDEMIAVHGSWAQFLNTVVKGKNLNVSTKEFINLMNDRIKNSLTTEYKIFADPSVRPMLEHGPSNDVLKEVAEIFMKSAKSNGKNLKFEDAELIVQDIVKNVRLDKNTASPIFKYEASDIAKEKALITKNIAENITGGGKFKPDKKGGLIQTEKNLKAFKKLFGEYTNANNIISNVTTDLAEIASRDRFYNVIKEGSEAMIKRGEIGIVYPTYNSARKAFGLDAEIIDASTGLRLPQKIGEQAYTVPINGMFTTKAIADGLKYGAANTMGSITKNIYYQYAIMIPKGLIQMGKTVGGPFTHARNFSSGAVTTVSLGNISLALTNPLFVLKSLKTAFNTLQPQILYRNKPGASRYIEKGGKQISLSDSQFADALKGEGGQSLYRFLLEEGMVNQSAIYRDVMGLIEDTAKTGFLQKMWNKLGKKTKGFLRAAQDMYVAEDDIWKIFNFLAEDFKINDAYAKALKNGTLKKLGKEMPNRLEIMKMATKNVREMLPNYAYVSEIVQASRRSPMGNFVSWPAEITRTSTNIAMVAKREMKDPILATIGMQRAVGFATTLGTLGPLAVWGGMQTYGFGKDKLMALREFVPWFSKDSTLIPVYEDGKYKYIDFSRAFFYDVVTSPFQTMFTEMNRRKAADEDDPVIPAMVVGLTKAIGRFIEPFVSESIWVGGVADIYMRGGVTKRGSRIWNDRDSEGDKIWKTIKHLTKVYSPGSNVQIMRLYAATTGKTLKGTQYDMSDELMGLLGLRAAPLDIPRSIEIMIGDFLKAERDERKLVYAGTLYGDPIEDDNKILSQYIFANNQRLETFNTMRRQYDAARTLGMSNKKIKEIFIARGQESLYENVRKNKFIPLGITEGMQDAYRRLSKKYNIKNPLSKKILKRLNKIEKKLYKQKLNQDYIIDEERYLFNKKSIIDRAIEILPLGKQSNAAPLEKTPQPVVNNAQMAQNVDPITGLTATQDRLLSPSDKAYYRNKNRTA